ncbi:hypothetical protein A9200_05055 [Maribacter hydrothermalis]|uniref:Uncharacterized protein n=2 Tax=Maribacter hydrothermalis TaxID=1836467 RepID=A0A1B7Z8L1_9FLAO|nr:hypothetical protein BTR34_17220 [Maribacter hydrothermalis]OBR39033.1 hypothetical protein A9200_05055 [Maribacter hydrothermalis]
MGFKWTYNFWYIDLIRDSDSLLGNEQFLRHIKSNFTPSLIILLPIIGIFINKKIGWILITSFFYMIIIALIFPLTKDDSLDISDYLTMGLFIGLIIFIITVMNMKKISEVTYGFTKSQLITKNIIASIIGMTLTIVIIYIKK